MVQVGFKVLITDARCYEGCDPPIDDVVIDVKATGTDECVLFEANRADSGFQRSVSAERGVAEHEIGVDAEKVAEMEGDSKAAQPAVVHLSADISERAFKSNVIRVQVLSDAIELGNAATAQRVCGPRDLGDTRLHACSEDQRRKNR